MFDSSVPIDTGQGVYMTAVAEHVDGDAVTDGIELFSLRSLTHGGRPFIANDVRAPARHRLYRATALEQYARTRHRPAHPGEANNQDAHRCAARLCPQNRPGLTSDADAAVSSKAARRRSVPPAIASAEVPTSLLLQGFSKQPFDRGAQTLSMRHVMRSIHAAKRDQREPAVLRLPTTTSRSPLASG